MALGTRELYLVLRARDEASRVLRGLSGNIDNLSKKQAEVAQRNLRHGQAMASMGIAIGAAGAVGVNALNSMTDAAVEYNKEASKTITQTDGLKVSLTTIANIGRDVAKKIPAPFEEMQGALYDIFSSMDVGVGGARKLLTQFAKDSVGGATEIQTAGRAVIEVLNAWDIPVKNVTKVSDVMFQLVRKGVGTYEEFAKTIGRSIPSAVAAGQSLEDLAGGMAFLTRRGLSTAMASTAMGRAMDALANPRSVKNLKELGINVKNSKGEFKPLVDIVNDMNKATDGMTKPQKTKWLKKAFQGSGGTIQAMRFFNHGLNDSSNLLDTLTKDMHNAGGEAGKAYKIMANTPAARIQELTNRYQIMRTEVGDRLIPIKMRLVGALNTLLKMWDKLSPQMKDIVVKGAAIAAGLMVVIGAVLAVAGVFLMFQAGLALAGTSLVGLLGPIGIVIGVLALLAAAVYLGIKHWDTLKPAIMNVANIIKGYAIVAFNALVVAALFVWGKIQQFGAWLWTTFGPTLMRLWTSLKDSALGAWSAIKDGVTQAWAVLKPFFAGFGTTMQQLWGIISMVAKQIWDVALHPLLNLIKDVLVVGIKGSLGMLGALFAAAATFIKIVFGPLMKFLAVVFGTIWDIIKNFVGLVYSIMKGDWKKAWQYAQGLVGAIFKGIVGILISAGVLIWSVVKGIITGVINFFKNLYNVLIGHSIIPDLVNGILRWWNKLVALATLAKQFMTDVVTKFRTGWNTVVTLFTTKIKEVKDKFSGAKKWLVDAGDNIVSGLKSGITGAINGIGNWVKSHIVDPIIGAVKKHFGIKSPSTVMAGLGGHLVGGLIKGIIDRGMSGSQWVSKIFGGFGSALGNFIDHGITTFKSLPSRLWGTVKGLGGHFATMVKKAQAAKAALSAGGNGGYSGPVGAGAGGIKALARHFHPSYIAGHRDPQGGPAFDIGSSGGKNNNIANAMRANHSKLGLRYVISQMRIASARSGWRWRRYTPITNKGDFRHTGHVHVSYANGGWINEHVLGVGQRSGKTYQFGEKGREYVSPEGKAGREVNVNVYTQEIDPVRHAAELGWKLAAQV